MAFILLLFYIWSVIGFLPQNCCLADEEQRGFMTVDYISMKLNTASKHNVFPLLEGQLRIVDSNRFRCDGHLTGLIMGATVKSTAGANSRLYPKVIIWRRENDGNINYKRRDSGELKPNFEHFKTSGVYNYKFPESIDFSEDDVLGIYQPPPSDSQVILHYTTSPQSFDMASYVRSGAGTIEDDVLQDSLQLVLNEYLLISPIVSEGESCPRNFLDTKVVQSLAPMIGNLIFPTNELRLFPDIRFLTRSNVTSWTIGGKVSRNTATQSRTELQIWRKTRNGMNIFYRIARYQLNEPSTDYNYTNRTTLLKYYVNPPLQVEAGDILGVFQPSDPLIQLYYQEHNGPNNGLIAIQLDEGLPLELQQSSLQTGTNDYPLIAVNALAVSSVVFVTSTNGVSTSSLLSTEGSNNKQISATTSSNLGITSSSPSMSIVSSNTDQLSVGSTPVITNDGSTSIASTSTSAARSSLAIVTSFSINATVTSQETPPFPEGADSNEALLISVTLVGTIILLITIPALIITVLAAVYIHRKSKCNLVRINAIASSEPSNNIYDMCQNCSYTSSSSLNVSVKQCNNDNSTRESMQMNPLYNVNVNWSLSSTEQPPGQRQSIDHHVYEVVKK